jgi:hypothetical protein
MVNQVGNSLDAARIAIENRVRAKWTQPDGQLLTPVKFEDKLKLESAGGDLDREPDRLPWLRVDILWGDAVTNSIGGGAQNTVTGVVQLTLFYPKLFPNAPGGSGIMQLADKARAVFDNYFGDGLNFFASSAPARADENNWKVAIIRTNFELYECAATE